MSKWTRDNGVFRDDRSLCAGGLIDLVRGNAEHMLLQCKTDITTPICGTLGNGVLITSPASGVEWRAAFETVRPFALPIRYNTNGTLGQIKFTFKGYSNGSSTNKIRVYLSPHPVGNNVTQYSAYWSVANGLLGSSWENYSETAIPSGAGEKTIVVTVQLKPESIKTLSPDNKGAAVSNNSDVMRTAPVTWAVVDVFLSSVTTWRFRTVRIQDVLT